MAAHEEQNDIASRIRSELRIADVIRDYIDIEEHPKGFIAMCPWHDDTRPAVQISTQRNDWKCWVCDVQGDSIAFVMKYCQLEFGAAVELLSERLADS